MSKKELVKIMRSGDITKSRICWEIIWLSTFSKCEKFIFVVWQIWLAFWTFIVSVFTISKMWTQSSHPQFLNAFRSQFPLLWQKQRILALSLAPAKGKELLGLCWSMFLNGDIWGSKVWGFLLQPCLAIQWEDIYLHLNSFFMCSDRKRGVVLICAMIYPC